MEKKYTISKKFKELPQADLLRFGNNFVDEYILDKIKIPINAFRIIFNIVSTIRNEQFQSEKQPKQLKLFEDEFATEYNSYAQISIKNSLITRDSEDLKKAYDFLELYKRGWYQFETSDGRKINALGGLISNIFYEEKGYTSFLISSYWLKKLLEIPEYNIMMYELAYKLKSTKHIVFAFWLNRLPYEGTKIKRETLNQKFDINYAKTKNLCKDFLKPIRENLDKYYFKSFNYKIEGELIHIKPYATRQVQIENLQPQTELAIRRNYTLRYIKERHQLKGKHYEKIKFYWKGDETVKANQLVRDKNIILDAYEIFIKKCRESKKKATDYTGQNFLDELQKYIIEVYSTRKKDIQIKGATGYPKIV